MVYKYSCKLIIFIITRGFGTRQLEIEWECFTIRGILYLYLLIVVRFEYGNKIKYQYRWNNYNSESEICVPAPYLWKQTIASSLQLQCNTQTIVWKSSLLPRHGFQRRGSSEHLRSSKEPAKCRSNNPRRCQTKAETARALMISWKHVAGLVLLVLNFLRRNIFPNKSDVRYTILLVLGFSMIYCYLMIYLWYLIIMKTTYVSQRNW